MHCQRQFLRFDNLKRLEAFKVNNEVVKLVREAINMNICKLERALAGKTFGRRLPYAILKIELPRRWQILVNFKLITVARDCYICILEKMEA